MKRHLRFYGTAALLLVLMLVTLGSAANAARPASEAAAPPAPGGAKATAPETHDRLGQLNWETVGLNTAGSRLWPGAGATMWASPRRPTWAMW